MKRLVAAEWLDQLPSSDRRAMGSRRDLRRLNFWMGHAQKMQRALRHLFTGRPPRRLAELGAGDGTLLLRLARNLGRQWPGVEVSLVDRQPAVSPSVRKGIEACGWKVEIVMADVFDWLAEERRLDGLLANLFLHHFEAEALERLLVLTSRSAAAFAACEPRRSAAGLLTGRLLWLLGCNAVTRHDAPISVRAGFRGAELSARWPGRDWQLREGRAGLFSHLFVAQRGEA
jgi:hypothetical protein